MGCGCITLARGATWPPILFVEIRGSGDGEQICGIYEVAQGQDKATISLRLRAAGGHCQPDAALLREPSQAEREVDLIARLPVLCAGQSSGVFVASDRNRR